MSAPPHTPTREADREFAVAQSAFGEAWAAAGSGCVEEWLDVAGNPARVRIAGRELADTLRAAFGHLRVSPAPEGPALAIDLWDARATGVDLPGVVASSDLNAHAEVAASADRRFVVTARPQTRTVLDRKGSRLLGWVGSHGALTQFERGRPLHAELLLWLRDRGIQAVHAGLVARGGAGVLLGGPGGSGKSTTALCCTADGFDYLADDYVAVRDDGASGYSGHSLYASTHLDPTHLRRFPRLVPHASAARLPREDKSLVLLSEAGAGRLAREASVRAIALPIVKGGRDTRVRPATAADALLRLAPSTLLQLPYGGAHPGDLGRLSDLVAACPTYWLELGDDLTRIPGRVAEILEDAA